MVDFTRPRWATIQHVPLTANHLGLRVHYQPYPNAPMELGILSSFTDSGTIYVRFQGPQGERCPPSTLTWAEAPLVDSV